MMSPNGGVPNGITRSLDTIASLQARVGKAVDEIIRLRRENDVLKRRLDEATDRPRVGEGEIVLKLDMSPDELRQTIDAHIEMLERYITPDTDSSP